MALDLTTLTDDEIRKLNLAPSNPTPAAIPSVGAAPDIKPDAPQGIPSLMSSPQGIPDLTKPTQKQSNVAGKAEFQRELSGLPQITPGVSTPEDIFSARIAKAEFDKQHPWGSSISSHPGAWGELGHIASKIGNVAGNIV